MKKLFVPLMLLVALFVSFNVFGSPVLNSLPTAEATIYLDFDGYNVNCAYWNTGVPFTCDPSGMTDAQITEVFNRVAEDYRPFDINITTDSSKFAAAPLSSRMRIVITPTSSWYPGFGGTSWIGSFNWGDDTPAFVFSDRLGPKSPKMVAECCSHESGHTIGLYHQSKYDSACNLTDVYNEGAGTGETSWAPIMGNSYYRNVSSWGKGPTPYGCTSTQDELAVITTQNGFTYRTDDYSDDINDSPRVFSAADANLTGVISTGTDKDAFIFTLVQKSAIHINVRPFSVDSSFEGADLDIKMSLYNSAHELVRTYDPSSTLDVVADTILSAGNWYMVVEGTGNGNVDDYGSLGSYSIASSATAVIPELTIVLTGLDAQDKHILNWNIKSNQPVKAIILESSTDGTFFSTLNTVDGVCHDFIYTPYQKADLYYRIRATSDLNRSTYSNTILLKSVAKPGKSFTVSTFIRNEITVDAPEDYSYVLTDMNGNLITSGKGQNGFNRVDMNRFPRGMYVIKLMGNNKKQTERIIKQ